MEREKRYRLFNKASEWKERRGTGYSIRPVNGKREEVQAIQ